jgi:hypothetical protein
MVRGFLLLGAPLLAAAAPAPQPAPPPAMPEIIVPEKVWPASAEEVDFGALEALPDWRGIWAPIMGPAAGPPPATPQLIGPYKAHYEEIQKLIKSGDPDALAKVERRVSACEPPGVPGIMVQPYNIEFLFTPGRVTIIQEAYMQVRRVFTDGRPLPEDPDPTYNGHSIGRWEGDTLVVTTVGLREGGSMGRWGITHSDQVRLTERIRLDPSNKDILVIENRFEDPKALAAPWQSTSRFRRLRSLDQIEFVCAQNDRNPINEAGEVEYLGVAD